jgi:hypothetical protein
MSIIHSDRLQLSIDIFTNIFLIFGFLTAFYQFYIIGMERSSIEGEVADAVDDLISTHHDQFQKLASLKPQLETINKLYKEDTDATKLNNSKLFGMAWMVTAVFALLVVVLAVSFFGYRRNPYFKKHPLSIGDILFKNFWMFIIAGGVEFAFFMKIATKFIPVPPSALGGLVTQAIRAEFGHPMDPNYCPQRDLRARNGERCSSIWLCATRKNELISMIVVGCVFLATILAVTLQPLAFPFLATMEPAVLEGVELDTFADLTPEAAAQVVSSTVIGGKVPRGQTGPVARRRQQRQTLTGRQRQQSQADAGQGFSF